MKVRRVVECDDEHSNYTSFMWVYHVEHGNV